MRIEPYKDYKIGDIKASNEKELIVVCCTFSKDNPELEVLMDYEMKFINVLKIN